MIIRWRQVFRRWLPGIISGGADNDPSGIATYAISGALFGFSQLWLLILSTPMLIAVQAMCARLGDVKRKGLMAIIKEHYSPTFALTAATILIVTNTATIAADLSAMADAIGLVTRTPYIFWLVPAAAIIWFIVFFENYRVLEKYLFFLTFLFLAYIASGFLAGPDWGAVFGSIALPRIELSRSYLATALALLGTTITPFLFFWQTKEEVEEHKRRSELLVEAKKEDTMVAPGFIYSNIVSFFIIISTGSVLQPKGITTIVTAADAARALEPLAGPLAQELFAVGIIGAGLLAVPVLAVSTAYVVAEFFGWRDSVSDKPAQAKPFYTVFSFALFVGLLLAFAGIRPMVALFYSQVLSGILAPVLIVMILLLCNNRKLMGKYANRWFDNVFGWLAVGVMVGGTSLLFFTMVQ